MIIFHSDNLFLFFYFTQRTIFDSKETSSDYYQNVTTMHTTIKWLKNINIIFEFCHFGLIFWFRSINIDCTLLHFLKIYIFLKKMKSFLIFVLIATLLVITSAGNYEWGLYFILNINFKNINRSFASMHRTICWYWTMWSNSTILLIWCINQGM